MFLVDFMLVLSLFRFAFIGLVSVIGLLRMFSASALLAYLIIYCEAIALFILKPLPCI